MRRKETYDNKKKVFTLPASYFSIASKYNSKLIFSLNFSRLSSAIFFAFSFDFKE